MCGIAGAVGALDDSIVAAVERMTDAEAHRGPDQSGYFSSIERGRSGRGAAFGHRRLSILDLTEAGRQPMIDAESGAVICFNGEVYNFAELARELRALGVELRSSSDTEVILKAYARWGERVIARLRGMFALAIWDPRTETVLFARDRLGIKPLYMAERDGTLLFASEVRALLASERIERRIDPQALSSYLWHGFVPGPRTIVEGIRSMPAGTTMRVGLDGCRQAPTRFWSLPKHRPIDEATAVKQLGEKLAEAVKLRLIADVPLGVFLSGGVDSSAIAALAQRASSSPITTFNIRFEEAKYDESQYARNVATILGTEHHEVTLSEDKFSRGLDDALSSIDQPTFDGINTYFVSRAVREAGLTVALAGTGGDELFGGYASFVDLPRAKPVARGLAPIPGRALGAMSDLVTRLRTPNASEVSPQTRWGKLADVLATRGDRLALYQTNYALFTRRMHEQLAAIEVDGLDWGLPEETATEMRASIEGEPDLSAISLLELRSFLGERLLRDTDAASMAVSLEVRVPIIDHEVVDAIARVPERRRFHPLRKKDLLKEIVSRELDPKIFDRPKAGFELPLEAWCRQRLGATMRETFRNVSLAYRVGLNGEALGRVWRAFERKGPGIYWSRVWSLFVLLRYCRENRLSL